MQKFAIYNVGIKGKQDISRVSVSLKVSIEEKVQIAPKICQVFDTKKPISNKFVVNLSSMLNPLDSPKTELLKTKGVDFSINNKQFSSSYFLKKDEIMLLCLSKNPKNNNIILVISISPIQRIGHNNLNFAKLFLIGL